MSFLFFGIILIIFGEGGYLPILRICQILNSRFKVGLSILMHPSTAVDPYLALNCAQHLAALLHGGVFFRKVSWISTKCVASSVKVCSGKLWPKSVKFGIGFLVTKCLNVLQKSPKDCTSMYFTRPNQIPNTTPFGILHWIVYNWHKCQIEGSLRHLRCCIPQILLHCAQCYSQKANVDQV